jgi:hypothetical protein
MGVRSISCAVLACAAVAGCGGTTIEDVAHGLKNAAMSKATYDALRHSDDLDATEKAAVNALCSVATQVSEGSEPISEQEYYDRLRASATQQYGALPSAALSSALGKVRTTVDLAGVSPPAARAYVRACFPWPRG